MPSEFMHDVKVLHISSNKQKIFQKYSSAVTIIFTFITAALVYVTCALCILKTGQDKCKSMSCFYK